MFGAEFLIPETREEETTSKPFNAVNMMQSLFNSVYIICRQKKEQHWKDFKAL